MKTLRPAKTKPAPSFTEQRRAPRKPAPNMTGRLYTPSDQQHMLQWTVNMVDLSLHGVGFRVEQAMTVGKLYGLEIRGNWMNLSSRIRIVFCRKRGNGEYDVGAEFY